MQHQAEQAGKQIEAEFERLQKFLETEKNVRLKAVAAEEEQKIAAIQALIENTNKDIAGLRKHIDTLKKEMGNEDLSLLRVGL